MSISNMTVTASSMAKKSLHKRASLARGIAALFIGGGLFSAATSSAYAQSGNWNVDAAGNWSNAANWNPAAVPGNVAGDIIGLNNNISAARTVTIDTTPRVVGILNIGDSNNTHAFTLAASGGANLTLNNSGSGAQINEAGSIADVISAPLILADNLNVTAAGSLTLSGVISETGGSRTLTKSGAGTLTLSATNTYSGTTTISAGVLVANTSSTLGNSSATNTLIFNGGTLRAGGAITSAATRGVTLTSTGIIDTNNFAVSIAGNMTGGGGLTKNSTGTLTLSGVNNYSGVTTVNAGTLQFANQASLYNSTAPTAANMLVKGGSTFAVNVDSAGTAGFLATELSAVLANISVANTAAEGLQKAANIGIDTTTAFGATFTPTAAFANSTGAFGGAIGLNKLGTGTLVLDLANTYTGPTIVSGGTLQLGNGAAGGSLSTSSPITIASGAIFSVNQNDTVTQGTDFSGGAISGAGGFTQAGAGTTVLNVANTFSGTTTVSAGTLTLSNARALQNSALVTTSGTSTIGAFSALTIGGLSGASGDLGSANVLNGYTGNVSALTLNPQTGVSVTYGGIISNGSGNMTLTKTGAGTQTLTGANTYTGATIVNAGTLAIGVGGSLSSSSTLQMSGGTFSYGNTAAGQNLNGLTVGAGNSTVNNTAAGQTLDLGAITRTASSYGTVNFVTLTGPISTSTANTNNIIGPWATTGSTTTLRYAVGAGSISGLTGTTATAGTLVDVTDATGNFEYSAAATTATDLTANTLRYSGAAATTAIGASNTLTLNGLMNAGTGLLTISGGPSTGGILIGSTGELVISANAQPTTISAAIGGTGRLIYNGGGTLLLNSATSSYTDGTVINAGQIRINSDAALGNASGSITLNGGALLGNTTNPQVGNAGGINISSARDVFVGPMGGSIGAHGNNNFTTTGKLSGSGPFTMLNVGGAGGQTLNFNSTSNDFTGAIFVPTNSPTISFNSLPDSSNNIVFNGAQGGTFAWGAGAITPLVLSSRAFQFNPTASGQTLTITNNNTASANANTITVNTDLQVTGTGSGTFALGGTNTGNNVFAGAIPNGSGLTLAVNKTGAGTWVLAGTNTYTGGTNLSAGVLQFAKLSAMSATGNVAAATGTTLAVNVGGAGEWTTGTSGNGTIGGLLAGLGGQAGGTVTYAGAVNLGFDTSNAGGAQTYTDVIPNVGTTLGVTKLGSGSLELSAPNTYTGTTIVNGGTLSLTGNRTGTIGAITVTSGSTLNISDGTVSLGTATISVGSISGTSTLNQTGGSISFTGGTQLLVANGNFGGIYNLSNGTLSTAAVANRGVIIGVNSGSTGVFNLSGTGNLSMAATSVLQVGRSENTAATGLSGTFNQTGGTATVGVLRVGGSSAGAVNNASITGLLNLTGGTFSAVSFTDLAGSNTSNATINIGGTADVTLPAFPTVRGTSSTATINFNGGTLRNAAASATYMGGLTNAFIKAGGATFNTANGDIIVTQDLLTDVVSLGGGLTKQGANTLTLTGNSTYTGATTVSQGKLFINGNNSAATGAVNVSALATLGGSGTIGGSTTVASTGIVAPGNSAGNLTFANGVNLSAGGVYSWELGALSTSNPGTDFDLITVAGGNLALAGTSALTLDFNLISGTDPNSADTFWTTGKSWKIIDVTGGTNTGSTNLSTITNASYSSGSFTTTVGTGGDLGDIFLVFTPVPSGPPVWQGADNDPWTAAASWTGGVAPNSITAEAKFVTTGGTTANLDANQTINKLTFDATAPHTISGSFTLSLAGTTPTISLAGTNTATQTVAVNLDLAAGTAVSVQGGTLELNSPANAVLGAGVTATVATGATLSLGGTGNALSNGTSTHANVSNSGTLLATTAGKRVGEISGSGTTTVTAAGATLTANHIRQSTLNIGAGNTVTVASNGGNSGTSTVTNLNINATGKLDLANNDLIVDNGNLATLTSKLATGLDINGTYGNGPGITSSAFASNPNFNTVLGIAANVELGYTSFSGQTVDANDILIKYTYYGDADLSGSVDTSTDFDLYITGLTSGGSLGGWLFGDFDYSGTVDSSTDFDLYITGLTTQGGALLTGGGGGNLVQAVPEPSTFVLGGLALLGFAGVGLRRRRLAQPQA